MDWNITEKCKKKTFIKKCWINGYRTYGCPNNGCRTKGFRTNRSTPKRHCPNLTVHPPPLVSTPSRGKREEKNFGKNRPVRGNATSQCRQKDLLRVEDIDMLFGLFGNFPKMQKVSKLLFPKIKRECFDTTHVYFCPHGGCAVSFTNIVYGKSKIACLII